MRAKPLKCLPPESLIVAQGGEPTANDQRLTTNDQFVRPAGRFLVRIAHDETAVDDVGDLVNAAVARFDLAPGDLADLGHVVPGFPVRRDVLSVFVDGAWTGVV